ncbi:sigma-70 family RNA polymerase sigma factor, partial [uncultured Caulobacter sp.]|uniref:sigma-70 family RNA polymerase sigma factor n=1 Tax=uncultured Caulobacter sp. TaxID=158749 RepID=UPI00261F78B2
ESAFYTWLYRIAVNTAKKALADLKRDPIITEAALAISGDDDETSSSQTEQTDMATPDAVLASKEIAATVNAAIDALSEDLRQAITLREIEGLSYEEIAEVMNCPIGTVRSPDGEFTIGNGGSGARTEELKTSLVNIQRGRAADPYGWIHKVF